MEIVGPPIKIKSTSLGYAAGKGGAVKSANFTFDLYKTRSGRGFSFFGGD